MLCGDTQVGSPTCLQIQRKPPGAQASAPREGETLRTPGVQSDPPTTRIRRHRSGQGGSELKAFPAWEEGALPVFTQEGFRAGSARRPQAHTDPGVPRTDPLRACLE